MISVLHVMNSYCCTLLDRGIGERMRAFPATALTVFSMAALMPCIATAGSSALKMPRWEQIEDKNDIKVWSRDVADSNIREAKAATYMDCSIERVWDVLSDIEHFPAFMPHVVEAKRIDVSDAKTDENIHYEYQVFDPPFLATRDFVLKVTSAQRAATSTEPAIFTREWITVSDLGPPPRESIVRVQKAEGRWTLRALGPNKTQVVYWMHLEPGGNVPSWIANKTNEIGVANIMEAVRKRALEAVNAANGAKTAAVENRHFREGE